MKPSHLNTVLSTPELLEHILSQTPPIEVWTNCRCVCRTWKEAIETSPTIRWHTYTTPSGIPPPSVSAGLGSKTTSESKKPSMIATELVVAVMQKFWKRLNSLRPPVRTPESDIAFRSQGMRLLNQTFLPILRCLEATRPKPALGFCILTAVDNLDSSRNLDMGTIPSPEISNGQKRQLRGDVGISLREGIFSYQGDLVYAIFRALIDIIDKEDDMFYTPDEWVRKSIIVCFCDNDIYGSFYTGEAELDILNQDRIAVVDLEYSQPHLVSFRRGPLSDHEMGVIEDFL